MSQAFDQLFEFIILLSSNTAPEFFPFLFITFFTLIWWTWPDSSGMYNLGKGTLTTMLLKNVETDPLSPCVLRGLLSWLGMCFSWPLSRLDTCSSWSLPWLGKCSSWLFSVVGTCYSWPLPGLGMFSSWPLSWLGMCSSWPLFWLGKWVFFGRFF